TRFSRDWSSDVCSSDLVTVNVFGEQMIDDANIAGLEELSDFTPGFQLQSAFGREGDRPVIRGASNILFSEGKVGFFVDGIPFVRSEERRVGQERVCVCA